MNPTREITVQDNGLLVATLTPEEAAKMAELEARSEQVEVALSNAKREARKARERVKVLKRQLKIINAKRWPLIKTRFPEL
jgi:chaperonin cofactor prefoldin